MAIRKLIESYNLYIGKVSIPIKITGGPGISPLYSLSFPQFEAATIALLDNIRGTLITDVRITVREILDPKVIDQLKAKFYDKISSLLKAKLPNIEDSKREFLIVYLINEMVGLGKLEFLLHDEGIEEIVLNSSSEAVRIYHKKYGWLETNVTPDSEEQIQNFSNVIARRVGRQITTLNPLLDAHLTTGDRANAVLYPISNKGHTITIRKFARDPWTVTDMINVKTASTELMALIWLSIQYEMNVLISGGTASGKTSFLNVCMPFIPPNHRIISMEDTRELTLPKFLYWCPLTTRLPNAEGKGGVTMLDLLVNSLRMRPDRIILGEMRRKQEAEVLFEAMHTGHSVYATVHANSLNETVERLVNPPIEVPTNLLGGVDLNVVLFRDRRTGKRRVFQVGEFITDNKGNVKTNLLYRWNPGTDTIVRHSPSIKFFENLSRYTGLNLREIEKDLNKKQEILKLLVKKEMRTVNQVGEIMKEYYLGESSLEKSKKS